MKHCGSVAFTLATTVVSLAAQAQMIIDPGRATLDMQAETTPHETLGPWQSNTHHFDFTGFNAFDPDMALAVSSYPLPEALQEGCSWDAASIVSPSDWYFHQSASALQSSFGCELGASTWPSCGLPTPYAARADVNVYHEVTVRVESRSLVGIVFGGYLDGGINPGDVAWLSIVLEESGATRFAVNRTGASSVVSETRYIPFLPGRMYTLRYSCGAHLAASEALGVSTSLLLAAGFNIASVRPLCPSDVNSDGSVDGDDVIAFFSAWDQNEAGGDYNQNGSVDGDDVIGFFAAWDSGC